MTHPASLDGQSLQTAKSVASDDVFFDSNNNSGASCAMMTERLSGSLYSQHQNEESEILSPGERLRQKRDQLGWSLDELVRRTHLKLAFIKALEWDQYDQLPGDAFIKGYLRTCGQIMSLDVSKLIQSYERIMQRAAPVKIQVEKKPNSWWQDAYLQRLGVGLILALLLLALVVVWPYFNLSLDDRSKSGIFGLSPASIAQEMNLEAIAIDSVRGDVVHIKIIDDGTVVYRLSQTGSQSVVREFEKGS